MSTKAQGLPKGASVASLIGCFWILTELSGDKPLTAIVLTELFFCVNLGITSHSALVSACQLEAPNKKGELVKTVLSGCIQWHHFHQDMITRSLYVTGNNEKELRAEGDSYYYGHNKKILCLSSSPQVQLHVAGNFPTLSQKKITTKRAKKHNLHSLYPIVSSTDLTRGQIPESRLRSYTQSKKGQKKVKKN